MSTVAVLAIDTPPRTFSVKKSGHIYRISMRGNAREWVTKMRRDSAQKFSNTSPSKHEERTFWKTVEMATAKLLQVGTIEGSSFWSDVSSQLKRTCSQSGYDDAMKQLFGIK